MKSPKRLYISVVLLLTCFCRCEKDEPEIPAKTDIVEILSEDVNSIMVKVEFTPGSRKTIEQGLVFSFEPNPGLEDTRLISPSPSATLQAYRVSELSLQTTYHLRGYVIDSSNKTTYSADLSFTTGIHEIASFFPAAASGGMEVTIEGNNLASSATYVYLGDNRVEANATNKSLTFIMPCGLDKESYTLAVEIMGKKIFSSQQIIYRRGCWTRLSPYKNFKPYIRLQATAANGKGYVIGDDAGNKLTDVYEYIPTEDSWVLKCSLPYTFDTFNYWITVGQDLYGINSSSIRRYQIATNEWSDRRASPFPNNSFVKGAFSVGENGFLLSEKQLWSFSSNNQDWVRLADYPGIAQIRMFSVTFDDVAYIIGGSYTEFANGIFNHVSSEVWRYTPATNTWDRKSDYPGDAQLLLGGFSASDKLYVGGGFTLSGQEKSDFWEYDPASDTWKRIADFKTNNSNYRYSFSIGNQGYIGEYRTGSFESFRLDL